MQKSPRIIAVTSACLLLAGMVLAAHAASPARQELSSALALTPDLANGQQLFDQCAACHGSDGSGAQGGSVPAIAGQHFRVVLKQLVDFRHDKRWDIRMEHFTDRHHLKTPQELADVAGYIAELPRVRAPTGENTYLQRGASVFVARCARCHGASGGGDDSAGVPRLAGQHREYTIRQMHDAADGRRPNMAGEHANYTRGLSFEEVQGIADYMATVASRD